MIIRPIITYNAETLTLSNKVEEAMRITERWTKRAILGPVIFEENICRVRINCEIVRELGIEEVVKMLNKTKKSEKAGSYVESGGGIKVAVDVGMEAAGCEEAWSAQNQMA